VPSKWLEQNNNAYKQHIQTPQTFDFSKNKEYTALRIAGGNRRRRIESIESPLLRGAVPPNDAVSGKSITPSNSKKQADCT
jgi:hypothetical protein